MEAKIEIPDFREGEEATMENLDPAAPTLASSESSEDWEKISEDWVSMFLDTALLDDQSRSLESFSQFDAILPETNDQFSSQLLLADSLLLHSANDPSSSLDDLVLGNASNVVDDLFGKQGCLAPEGDLIRPKREPTTSSSSSVTRLSGNSSSRTEIDLWIEKEGNSDMSTIVQRKSNGEASPGSDNSTFPSSDGDSDLGNNQLHGSSCKEGEAGSGYPGNEAVVSRAPGMSPSASQSETFGIRHIQSIGKAIKDGLRRRSGDDDEESNKPEICEVDESFRLQNLQGPQDQLSDDHGDRKEEVQCGGGDDGNEKRFARLMRNRESAQLCRQKKKMYVDELEGKLQTITATVAELHSTISHLTAENVNLRRQLGYYFPAPGACPPGPGMPMHVLPMGPYPGMAVGRLMYPGGQIPPIPIPRLKTQTPARNSKRTKSGVSKEGGDTKRTKMKAAGAASTAIVGLLCVSMLFGSFDYGSVGVDELSHVGNVRVGGRVLSSWNEDSSPLNNTGSSTWNAGPGWAPLQPGEYGPEREGFPCVHEGLSSEANLAQAATIKIESSNPTPTDHRNATLATSLSPGYSASANSPLNRAASEAVLANTSQSFAASVFIPGSNGLIKVDGNLIIQAVMAGDKAAKKQSEKRKTESKKKREKKKMQVVASAVGKLPTEELDNLSSQDSKVVKNASTARPFVTVRPLAGKVNSVVETHNQVSSELRAGSLQQWMLGGLQDPETVFVASELTKKIKTQPHVELPIDNLNAVAATQGTFYSFTPFDAVPRGPLNSWFYSGLATDPITWEGNISNFTESMLLPIRNEKKLGSLPLADSIPQQPLTYDQFLRKKAQERNTCSVPTLSTLFGAAAGSSELANAGLQQCLATDRPILSNSMCQEIFQFDTRATSPPSTAQDSSPDATSMAESSTIASSQQHKVTSSPFVFPAVAPRSRRDPFAVPLPPIKPKPSSATAGAAEERQANNGTTDPRVENTIREQFHHQNLQHGVSSMVVSVLAGPEDWSGGGESRGSRKSNNAKGLSRIFVVVLVDNQKYVTYSCMLPAGGL